MLAEQTRKSLSINEAVPSDADVVVIGGGVMGCSIAYHLAKLSGGTKRIVLLERDKLTSGTTWHSAAQVRQLRSTENLTRLIQYSTELYAALETETGQSTGWLQTGSISIATNPDRLTHIRRQAALSEAFGITAHEIKAREVTEAWPLANVSDVIGAIHSPNDGRVNPSDLCAALIKGFRARGGGVHEHTPVTGLRRRGRRLDAVETKRGTIRCETVVLTGGLWSAAIGALAGIHVPLYACEHFYLLTKPLDGVIRHRPTLSDHDGHLYIRDESGGLLVGCFEPRGKPIDVSELPTDFAFGLLNEDWDHFEPMMHNAIHRIPALEHAEVRMLVNGPESFTPDGAFLLGPSAEVDNLFLLCGMNSVGAATGGGAGKALAQWILEGGVPMDLTGVDPRRFPPVESDIGFLRERTPEVLGKHYAISFPGHEWKSGRGLRRSPLHDDHLDDGAQFGQRFGWERPLLFGAEVDMTPTFGKAGWHDVVAEEVEAAHARAALFDQSTFGKIRVAGPDAEVFLQRVCANDMARDPGRVIYTALLDDRGCFQSDLTAQRIAEDEYVLYVNTNSVLRDLAWFLNRQHNDERVAIADVTEEFAVIGLMGPSSANVLSSACDGYNPLGDLPFFSHRTFSLSGIDVRAARLSYVGEPGWEITVRTVDAPRLYRILRKSGQSSEIRPAGLIAQTSMRIEKGFLSFGHDITPDDTPVEAGLIHATKLRKNIDFIGRIALERRLKQRSDHHMVTILLDSGFEANPIGGEPIRINGGIRGRVTSASFGYRVKRPVCLGYLKGEVSELDGASVEVDIAGQCYPGRAQTAAAFDPSGRNLTPGARVWRER
ncbi:FAD-dependent oxidoreductase [Mesorhizobium sp. VK25A]|uniref:FAD-dependent oxidoreductase n=1 Tax=Mesorhizobium vachelliae TaxID=3072309 RepID=A0ABU5AF99_9HYPH|nr:MULTISPECIES: FAD-dependent oxidoreductase [unclassified Mesorhizobium]MDX8535951.1 FAD-dependent oxidoreductase [Mesorhizobium sp. VK25D]MDX8548705.1 FAD-dependent oxidoreductase [Mesorhizobium sp. VK25A]